MPQKKAAVKTTTQKSLFQWLLSPWVILACLIGGVLMGIEFPTVAVKFSSVGDLYLRLLQMCVIPVMVSAIVTSVYRLFSSGMSGKMLARIIGLFCAGLVLASSIGLGAGLFGKPGLDLDQQSRDTMGKFITSYTEETPQNISTDLVLYADETKYEVADRTADLISEIIPSNIFNALQAGHTMQILFVSLLLGLALSFIPIKLQERLVVDLDAVFQTFIVIINWIMYLLPIALFFLIANQVAEMGLDILRAMMKYIAWVYVGALLLVLINALLIGRSTKKGFFRSFWLLRQPLIISFFTRNGYAAMPSAIEAMGRGFKIRKTTTNLIIPLGITIFRFGTIMVFSLSAVFLAQLFGLELDFKTLLTVLFASVLAGVASAGAPGVVALTMISMVLAPLGLPLEVAIVLLLAVDPVTDPILTLLNVHTNCTVCALSQEKTK
jgi:Na+/H+-dicarboxylate symporter